MENQDFHHLKRLFVKAPLEAGLVVALEAPQAHYLKTVLRLQDGARVRVFNGQAGEFTAVLQFIGKRDAALQLEAQIRPQAPAGSDVALAFPLIKKDRMDLMVEKAVELGVTTLIPLASARAQFKTINEARMKAQILEAAEQCERLDIPELLAVQGLAALIKNYAATHKIFAALERRDAPLFSPQHKADPTLFIIGPEGGFDKDEAEFLLQQKSVTAVSLGRNILRAETAAITMLARNISD